MVATTPHTIIYIEDDQGMIDLLSMFLNSREYKITGVTSGKKGLDLVQQNPPDLILLDLMIPDMDGWEIYQNLKSVETTKNIPVIIITAKAQAIDRVLGLTIAKVDDYICKPFRPQDLLESIKKILDNSPLQTDTYVSTE